MRKLFEKINSDKLPLLYTGERILQLSSLLSGINTVVEPLSIHDELLKNSVYTDTPQLLISIPNVTYEAYLKRLCATIVPIYNWAYIQEHKQPPLKYNFFIRFFVENTFYGLFSVSGTYNEHVQIIPRDNESDRLFKETL